MKIVQENGNGIQYLGVASDNVPMCFSMKVDRMTKSSLFVRHLLGVFVKVGIFADAQVTL